MPVTINGTTGIAGVDGSAATPSVQGSDTNTGVFYPAADTVAVSTGGSERMRVDSSGNVGIGTSTPGNILDVFGNTGDMLRLSRNNTGAVGNQIAFRHSNAGTMTETASINAISTANADSASLNFYTKPSGGSSTLRASIDSSGNLLVGTTSVTSGALLTVNGGIADSIGNVRSVPQNSQTGAYVLVATDNGKHISITTGGVTVPASVFSAGQVVSIYNNSGSNQTITQGGSVTLRQAGTANTGNRTLAQYGLCTILCVASNTFVISGSGLT